MSQILQENQNFNVTIPPYILFAYSVDIYTKIALEICLKKLNAPTLSNPMWI